jgi:hypothetical protein
MAAAQMAIIVERVGITLGKLRESSLKLLG